MLSEEFSIQKTQVLAKMKNSEEAKKLLERLRYVCAPAMSKNRWRVGVLREFFPKEAGLLGMNVNRGASILIRLRPADHQDSFLPWEDILGTMVHELTHMEISSHSAEFYRRMDSLCDEIQSYDLTNRSVLATGIIPFAGTARKLGGATAVTATNRRELLLEAARKRQRIGSGESHRLGGSGAIGKSAEERRRLQFEAAERRRLDDIWCHDGQNKFVVVDADYDCSEDFKDEVAIKRIGDDQQWVASANTGITSASSSSAGASSSYARLTYGGNTMGGSLRNDKWKCDLCSRVNSLDNLTCLCRQEEGIAEAAAAGSTSKTNLGNPARNGPKSSVASSSDGSRTVDNASASATATAGSSSFVDLSEDSPNDTTRSNVTCCKPCAPLGKRVLSNKAVSVSTVADSPTSRGSTFKSPAGAHNASNGGSGATIGDINDSNIIDLVTPPSKQA
jgi:hypothetical protein